MKIQFYIILIFGSILLLEVSCSPEYPTSTEIMQVIKEEVDNGRSSSIVVGIIDNGKESYISYGLPFEGRSDSASENTIYELASVTKAYVGTIFADMVLEEKLSLDDLLIKFLPDTLQINDDRFNKITLQQLATHTTGIPKLTRRIDFKVAKQSYNEFILTTDFQELFENLENLSLVCDPGTKHIYENDNIALLSYVICSASGKSLEELFKQYFFEPFQMHNSGLSLTEKQMGNFATAYRRPGFKSLQWGNFSADAYLGAAALKSCTKDQITFMRKLFYDDSQLNDAVDFATKVYFEKGSYGRKVGLGWYITESSNQTIANKGGSSAGSRSAMGYDIKNNRGVVIISNSSNDIIDIFLYLFDKNKEIQKFVKYENKPIEKGDLEKFQGNFMLKVKNIHSEVKIYTDGDMFYINQYEIFYQGDNSFFVPKLKTMIEFTDLEDGVFQSFHTKPDGVTIGERIE